VTPFFHHIGAYPSALAQSKPLALAHDLDNKCQSPIGYIPETWQAMSVHEEPQAFYDDMAPKSLQSPLTSKDDSELIRSKLRRVRAGGSIRYMDMFAGCGGISLGFLTAGCTPVASVESDLLAALSHGANFGPRSAGGELN